MTDKNNNLTRIYNMNDKKPICIYSLIRNILLLIIMITGVVIITTALPLILP